jgi:hypothetical protein
MPSPNDQHILFAHTGFSANNSAVRALLQAAITLAH